MTVEKIREIRTAEAKRTKNMSTEELLKDSSQKGGELWERLLALQKNKTKV